MTWPEDRLRTYTADSPVRSTDLNELQDAHIGMLHGLVPVFIDASAFVAVVGAPVYIGVSSAGWIVGASEAVEAPIPMLRPGATVDSIEFFYKRASGTISFELKRRRTNSSTPAQLALVSVASGTSDTSQILDSATATAGSMPQTAALGGSGGPFVARVSSTAAALELYYAVAYLKAT